MQGYDSIPTEIPNPKAKKVHNFLLKTSCSNEMLDTYH